MSTLLVLDYPGRRPEAHISDMNLEQAGFDCVYALTSPLPTALTTVAYAAELHALQHLEPPLAVVAYCAAAPLAVALGGLLAGPAGPAPIVLLDPQATPPDEIDREYHEVVRQVQGRSKDVQRPPLLDIERLIATPELLIERIGVDLRMRASLALASFGFTGAGAGGPVESVVGVYIEWLTFLIAAHHDRQPPPGGPVLQVISQGHPADAGWLGATGLRTARIPCDRPELASDARTRTGVLGFLRQFVLPAAAGTGHEG